MVPTRNRKPFPPTFSDDGALPLLALLAVAVGLAIVGVGAGTGAGLWEGLSSGLSSGLDLYFADPMMIFVTIIGLTVLLVAALNILGGKKK